MEKIDTAAAENLQTVFSTLQNGPWHTGSTGAKGAVITEPLICSGAATDTIKRYTDKYIQTKTIGRTAETYAFNPQFLPRELYKSAGLKIESSQDESAHSKSTGVDVQTAISQGNFEETEEADKSDGDENKDAAEVDEDEFEELEDDDYNAEKYFDDGDEFGEGDDGDDEAAY